MHHKQAHSFFTLWPYLEVLDLSNNKLNDFDEIVDIFNGSVLNKIQFKMVAVGGNQFCNFREHHITNSKVSLTLEGAELT